MTEQKTKERLCAPGCPDARPEQRTSKPVCGSVKMGEYNMLSCVRAAGHHGPHNYCVDHELDMRTSLERKR